MEDDFNGLLEKALSNDKNEEFLSLNNFKIEKAKERILKKIYKTDDDKIDTNLEKLKDYYFTDEVDKLKLGSYIRWIKNKKLTKGSLLVSIEVGIDGVILKLKNTIFGNLYSLNFDDNIFVFQKLTNQELVILLALETIKNTK